MEFHFRLNYELCGKGHIPRKAQKMEELENALRFIVVNAYREWGILGAIGVLVAGIALIFVLRFLGAVWSQRREVGQWIVNEYRGNPRLQDVRTTAILSTICAVVLVIAAFSDWPYFMYTLLRLFICCSSAYLAFRFYSRHRVPLAWLSGAIGVLFNPILPVKMARSDWETTNAIIAAVFFAISVFLVWESLFRQRVGEAQHTDGLKQKESAEHWFQKALLLTDESEYKECFQCLERAIAADPTHFRAMYGIAHQYMQGNGVPQDQHLAFKWFRKAAEFGYFRAQDKLGLMYEHGIGVTKDLNEAEKWYLKAAEQEDPEAQYHLGVLYGNGEGFPRDNRKSFDWIRKAAEQGHSDAQFTLGRIYMEGHGISQNQKEAAKWLRKAAEQGDNEAEKCLFAMLPPRVAKAMMKKLLSGEIDEPDFLAALEEAVRSR